MTIRMDWRLIPIFVLGILFFSLATVRPAGAQSCTGVPSSTTGTVTWNPQWCQEFNATTPSAPDTTVWSFDLGNGGFGNNEVETYCGPPGYAGNPSNCPSTFATGTSNAYLDGTGHLVIQVIDNSGTWYSARMKTQGLQNFQYGRIEASIQLPDTTNPGLWPAFWSLGTDITTTPWPACGEVDFMENWSPQVLNGPGPAGNKTTIHTSATGGSGIGAAYAFPSGQQADTAFHTYGTIWSANMMQFYVDDATKPFLIETPSDLPAGDVWPFNAQIFLLMNVAVGGTLGGATTNTPSPDQMLVDYVRQYQASTPVAPPVMGTPPSISVKAGAVTGNTSTFAPVLGPDTGYAYFSCATNAPKASCAITTNDPLNKYVTNASANPLETVTVTVTSTANTAGNSIPPSLLFRSLNKVGVWLPLVMGGLILPLGVRRQRSRKWLYGCTLVLAVIFLSAMNNCGGSSNSTSTPPTGNNGTTPGSYSVTAYAFTESNSGSGANSTADASVSIPLTVN